jgi:rod shape-determining protein MreD
MIRRFRFALCAVVLFVVQTALVHRFTYGIMRPDLLCAAAVYLALEAGFTEALWGALLLGLLRDLGSCGRLGASALLFPLAAAGLQSVKGHLVRESFLTDLALTFACVLLYGVADAVATAALTSGPQLGDLLPRAIGQAVFTTALSPLLFAALARVAVVDTTRAVATGRS